jgi:hypothetical protein
MDAGLIILHTVSGRQHPTALRKPFQGLMFRRVTRRELGT